MKMEKMTQLTEHFTLEELSRTSAPCNNEPSDSAANNLRRLCAQYLEPLRKRLDQPIIINSGYRSKETNTYVGGVNGSYHLYGCAVDIHCDNCAEAFQMCGILVGLDSKYMMNINKMAELLLCRSLRATWVHLAIRKSNNDTKRVIGFRTY